MFWITAIAAFSGMRLSEITQLRASDIHVIDDVTAISVNADEGKSVKTASGVRVVPVHKVLLRAGFNEFVEKARKHGADARLFEELYAAKHPSGSFSKRFAHLLDRIGITDKRFTFHGWRHSLKAQLENVGVAGERLDAIFGWAGHDKGMRSTYGGRLPVRILAAEINKAAYGDLQLTGKRHEGFEPHSTTRLITFQRTMLH